MQDCSILIFVVAFNAEDHILQTLDRIPRDYLNNWNYKILIIDDASEDTTHDKCQKYATKHVDLKIDVLKNTENLGYGGNQKLGYRYAIKYDYGVVVLLHGDGQYAPEYLNQMIAPIVENSADVVLGSRMLDKNNALKGGMPIYKWIGNQVLTQFQNWILATNLAEFHTGYRAFSVNAIKNIPYLENSDYFDFDTEILIQLVDKEYRFKEIAIPTFYGNEISYVNGIKYAWLIVITTVKSRFVKKGYGKDARFTYD